MLSVLHFLRSFFKTPEPDAQLRREGVTEDLLSSASRESEPQGWSQDTEQDDFETLSHQSESPLDTNTEPFESASDTESLDGAGHAPSDSSLDIEALRRGTAAWSRQPLTGIPVPDPGEELYLHSNRSEGHTLAAVSGEPLGCGQIAASCSGSSQHPKGWHGAMGSHRLQPAVAFGRLSALSRQKSRSESCLGIPVVWPFLLCCCELGQSWPHSHSWPRGPGLCDRGPQSHTDPLRASRTRRESRAGPPDLSWTPPGFDVPGKPPLGTSYRLCVKCHHSTSESLDDKDRAFPTHGCPHMETLTRAYSLAGFPFRRPKDPPGQDFVKSGTYWKEGTIEQEASKPQKQLPGTFALESSLCILSLCPQRRTLHFGGQHKCCKGASQHMPSRPLCLGNPLQQDCGPCPASACLTAELGRLTAEEVALPTACKSEHSPECRPEEARGVGPAPTAADGSDKQNHLQDISVEAGNPTSNYTSKYVLSGKRRRPARAQLQHHSRNSGSGCWDRDCLSHPGAGNNLGAPGTTLKSGTSEGAGHGVVLHPSCTNSALEGSLTAVPGLSLCSTGCVECERGLEQGPATVGACLQLEPRAGGQKGLQATKKEVGPCAEVKSCLSVKERPGPPPSAGVAPGGSPRIRKARSPCSMCELSASNWLGGDVESQHPLGLAAECGVVMSPQGASEEWTLSRDTCGWEHLGDMPSTVESAHRERQGATHVSRSGSGAERADAAREPRGRPGDLRCVQDPRHTEDSEAHGPEALLEVLGVQDRGAPDGSVAPAAPENPGAPTAERALELRPWGTRSPCQETPEPRGHLAFPKAAASWKSHAGGTRPPSGRAPTLNPDPGPQDNAHHAGGDPVHGPKCPLSPSPKHQGGGPGAGSGQQALGLGRPASRGVSMSTPTAVLQGAGQGATRLAERGDAGTLDYWGHPCQPPENSVMGLRSPEKRFRTKLALAHKTFSQFFESKVEKEDPETSSPGAPQGQKKSKARPSSWRAFLRSRDTKGPHRLTLGALSPGPQPQKPPSPAPAQARSPGDKPAPSHGSLMFGAHWAHPQPPTAMDPAGQRRKSEPAIKCTHSAALPDGAWPLLPCRSAQQVVVSRTLPSSSACCLAYAGHMVPCKPLSPKPCSPRTGPQQLDRRCPGWGSAVSMVSLGSSVDGRPAAAQRCWKPKARASLLLSLQTLAVQEEEGRKRGRLSTAPSLGHLPSTQVFGIPFLTKGL